MNISSLNHNIYYQNDSINNNREDKVLDNSLENVNNLKSIYIDSNALSELNLKSAHTSDILSKKVKEMQESRPLKDVNFEKESKNFDKSNIDSVGGSLKSSQASFISSKRVAELLK